MTNTVYQIEPEQASAPECLLCEEVVRKAEKKIANDKSKVCILYHMKIFLPDFAADILIKFHVILLIPSGSYQKGS